MTQVFPPSPQGTLRSAFNRRLLLLLLVFSVLMSSLVLLAYQYQTDKFNRNKMSDMLAHLALRLKGQQVIWTEQSNHLLSIIEWSGMLALVEPARHNNLQAFFVAQSENMIVDGVVVTDKKNSQVVFSFWSNFDHPQLKNVFSANQKVWYDEKNAVLYSVIRKAAQIPGHDGLDVYFFKAWDSALLNRITVPDATLFLALDNKPLLSSAGSLALQEFNGNVTGYFRFDMNDVNYLQDSRNFDEIRLATEKSAPLELTVRIPEKRNLPIQLILTASISIILLFAFMLFMIMGRWLINLGVRLDELTQAANNFQDARDNMVSDETRILLDQADAGRKDQISVLSKMLAVLMKNAALRDEEQRTYLQTLDMLQDAVIEFTTAGKLIRATEAWNKLTGFADIADCGIDSCVHPEDVSNVMEQISALTHLQKQQVNIRFRMRRKNDVSAHYWVEGRFAAVKTGDAVVCIRGVVRDITNTYRQERQISHMALHDALTDLPNRVLLEDRMEMAISRAARSGQRVALGFIDLDHFKQVNDNFGHKIGDRMLREVSERLGTVLRGTDTLSRWGGDEFVVLCPDLESLENVRDITRKLSLLTQQNIAIDGTEFPFTFSAGFAVYPDDADDSETLLAQADRAMFYAKAQGRNNIQFFNAIARKETGRLSFYIQSRLSNAINTDQIQAWLQPLVSATTGCVIGAEVLARWHEPEQGWIPPTVFIPMAESLGLIDKLGQSVWQQALHAFTLLPEDHRLSVNLSKRQLFSNTIVQQFCDDVERTGISPARIMLEITESIALSDVSFARERIVELDSKGFGIAIDDFGVGYSSLSQLHEIPADELKLDISFVRRIHEKTGLGMATAIVSIAKSLDMTCVAEGVEDAETAALLAKMGVEVLQGYYFAKPMPIEDYIIWLEARQD